MPVSKNMPNERWRSKLGQAIDYILWFVLFITIIGIFVPFSPEMPGSGVDWSWAVGMNQAMAQGLSFGKEIIFTFGPYASVYTKAYHPSTDFMMLGASLYLALSCWASLVLLLKDSQWRWVLAFCVFLAGFMYARDVLLFSLPMIAGLLTIKALNSEEAWLAEGKLAPFYVLLLFAPFGLLLLIKGNIVILCGAVAALCSALFFAKKHRLLAMICLFAPIVSMLFFWIASGQSVTNLPDYFISMASLVSGYTEAMALDGNSGEVILFLLASASLLLAISIQTQLTGPFKKILFCLYFVFLFSSFKAGFVRHDHHAILSGTAILMAALLLPFVLNTRIILPAIVLALISWFYIDNHYIDSWPERIAIKLNTTYTKAWSGVLNRIENRNFPRPEFDAAMHSIRQQASFPVLQGTTDIYSANQSFLISSGNSWSPRPIFQSYSVYTPTLAEINRRHLLGNQAPDNIIFRVEPIDGRIPSSEDGASWPILLLKYRPVRIENDFLFLRKNPNTGVVEGQSTSKSEKHVFGESVGLAEASQPVFAQIEIKPTILGRLASIFFKTSQLQITFDLKNGLKKKYRLIAGMAKSGFLMSPLIESTTEFGMLYGKKGFLDGKLVRSVAISPMDGGSMLWNDEYTVTFSQISPTVQVDLSDIYKFDRAHDELSISNVTAAENCDGVIDEVNNTSPAPTKFSAAGLLQVSGWLAASLDKPALPEAVYVVLTDLLGNKKYLGTHPTSRPDVGASFKAPLLNASGYRSVADISALKGEYFLGIAKKISGKVEMCPQFRIPVTIAN